MSFYGKNIVITGASSGIGEAVAKEFLSLGSKVILIARSIDKMKDSFKNYPAENVSFYPFDLTNLDGIEGLISKIITEHKQIDILFNNAGISQFGQFQGSSLKVINDIMQLDYFSVVYMTKYVLEHMIKNGTGHIVTNTSVAGKIPSRNRTAYSSAKYALHGFFDSLRIEVANQNIDITLVAPGRVDTGIGISALTESGKPYGKNDRGHSNGLSVQNAAKKIIKAIKSKKREAVISKWSDIANLGIILRNFFPSLYFALAKKIKA